MFLKSLHTLTLVSKSLVILTLTIATGRAPELVEGDDGWLGAWWLGFVVVGGLTALVAPLLALFPQRLPGEEDTEVWKLENWAIAHMYYCWSST